MELLINKKFWEKLSPGQQRLLEITCEAATVDMLSYSEAIQGEFVRKNEEKHHIKNMTWSPELLEVFHNAWLEVAAEESAKDPFFKKVWDDLSAFTKENKTWTQLGYLPRETKVFAK